MRGRTRIALLAGVSAIMIGGCGSGDDGTIPTDQSDALLNILAAVEGYVQEGDCDHAAANAEEFTSAVNDLPDEVDRELRSELTEAAVHLTELAQDPTECLPETGATGPTGTDSETPTETPATDTETPTTPPEQEEPTPEEPTQEEPTEDPNLEPDTGQGQGDQGSPDTGGNGGTESGGTQAGGGGGKR